LQCGRNRVARKAPALAGGLAAAGCPCYLRPVASSPDAGGSRHVGRVTDPLARQAGQPEPELELVAPAAEGARSTEEIRAAPGSQTGPEPDGATAEVPTLLRGRALRERLLERAGDARRRAEAPAGLEEAGQEPLDELARPFVQAPSAPVLRRRRELSPDMVAVFGTLLGLATVASIVALAIHLEPGAGLAPRPDEATAAPERAEIDSAPPRRERARVPGPWRIADAKDDPGLKIVEKKIGPMPFLRALQEAGLPKKEAYRVLTAFKGVRDFDRPSRTDSFIALLDRSTLRVKAFEYVVSLEEILQAREGADGLLAGKRLDLKVERGQVKGAFAYKGGDLDGSAAIAGFDPGLSRTLEKAVEGHLSIQELERGDMLRIVAQEVTVLGEFSRYAGIEALEWRPVRGKPLRLYYFRGSSARGYFDEKGRSPYEGGWRKPIPTAPITSKFNPRRMHPVVKKIMPHTGTDFGAAAGTPVGASSYGTVSFIGYAGPSGNLVKIEHAGEIETGYAHLSRFAEGLRVGDRVKRMQVIGYVGSTGRSTGPHLHFTVKKKGEFIDPETLNLDGMRVLPKEERDAFQQAKQKYDALLDSMQLPEPLPLPDGVAASAGPDEVDLDPGEEPAGVAPPAAPEQPPSGSPRPAAPSRNPVYLSDKELLLQQPVSDDGEVSE
jgi:murein DD-endopeptidase MepM/ murein hydrolase activator NlpD